VLFVGGALLLLWLPAGLVVPPLLLPGLLLFCVLLRPVRAVWPLPAGALLAALSVASWQAGVPPAADRLLVEAQVSGLPRQLPDGWQFDADLSFPREPARAVVHARVTWRGAGVQPVAAGESWHLAVTLRPPESSVNPGLPEATRHLLRDHVQALGQVLDSPLNRRSASARPGLTSLRERLARRIGAAVDDPSASALLAALAVGDTTLVQPEQWRVFNATGITHLVAISGMHVTVFAVAAMAACRRLWRIAAARGLRLRREPCAIVAGLLLATMYALLAGFSVPTQRTLVMLAAWLGWRAAGRMARPSASVAVALVIVVAFDPLALLSAGFWLSFVAVAAIIAFVGCRVPAPRGLRAAAAVQYAVAVALLPLSLLIFDGYSLAGLLVNIAAIPLFSWLLVPPVLLATALLLLPLPGLDLIAQLLLACAGQVAVLSWPWLTAAADLPHALFQAAPLPGWYPLAAVGVLLAVLPWTRRLRLLALSCLVPLAMDTRQRLPAGEFTADVLDVGRGLAVLVATRHQVLLFGTGERFGSRGRTVERVVVPVARWRGLARVDRLVAGRLTADAGDGVTAAVAFLGRPLLAATAMPGRDLAPEFTDCARLAGWDSDGVSFRPLRGAAGCSLWIGGAGGSLLLVDPALRSGSLPTAVAADAVVATSPPLPDGNGQFPSLAVASIARVSLATESWLARVRAHDAAGVALYNTGEDGALRLGFPGRGPITVTRETEGRLGRWSRIPRPRADRRIRYDAAPCGKSSVQAASSCGRSSSVP
jgi:competence protein ComEC